MKAIKWLLVNVGFNLLFYLSIPLLFVAMLARPFFNGPLLIVTLIVISSFVAIWLFPDLKPFVARSYDEFSKSDATIQAAVLAALISVVGFFVTSYQMHRQVVIQLRHGFNYSSMERIVRAFNEIRSANRELGKLASQLVFGWNEYNESVVESEKNYWSFFVSKKWHEFKIAHSTLKDAIWSARSIHDLVRPTTISIWGGETKYQLALKISDDLFMFGYQCLPVGDANQNPRDAIRYFKPSNFISLEEMIDQNDIKLAAIVGYIAGLVTAKIHGASFSSFGWIIRNKATLKEAVDMAFGFKD